MLCFCIGPFLFWGLAGGGGCFALAGCFPLLRRGIGFFLGASSSDDDEEDSELPVSALATLFFAGGFLRLAGGARCFFFGAGFGFRRGTAFFLGASSV